MIIDGANALGSKLLCSDQVCVQRGGSGEKKAGGLWQVESGEHSVALRWMGSRGPVLWLHHSGGGGVSAENERVPGHLPLEKHRNSEVGLQRKSLS